MSQEILHLSLLGECLRSRERKPAGTRGTSDKRPKESPQHQRWTKDFRCCAHAAHQDISANESENYNAAINVMPTRGKVGTLNFRAHPTWGILANFEHKCWPGVGKFDQS